MNKLSTFASEANPLRVSSVPNLMRCAARSALMFLEYTQDEGGVAAHSGSAFHTLVEAWHQSNHDAGHAIRIEQSRRHEWPQADIAKSVMPAFEGYIADPRNKLTPLASELEIKFKIDPSPDDPTQDLIYLMGHIDQVRADENGQPRIWDMKLSRKGGGELINSYAYQIVMYAVGATKYLGREVLPGGIIRCSTYSTKEAKKFASPDGVFFPVTASQQVMDHMVRDFARVVAAVRRGDVSARPGDWCSWCPIGHISRCVPLLERSVKSG